MHRPGGKERAGIPQSPQDKTAADERHKAAKEVFPANVVESREAFFRPTKAQERLKRQGFGLFDFSQVSSKVISQQKQFAKKSNKSSVSAQFRGSPQFNTKFWNLERISPQLSTELLGWGIWHFCRGITARCQKNECSKLQMSVKPTLIFKKEVRKVRYLDRAVSRKFVNDRRWLLLTFYLLTHEIWKQYKCAFVSKTYNAQ